MRRLVRKTCCIWESWVHDRISDLAKEHKNHGLDLSKSGFLKTEVLKADECIYVQDDDKIIAFVFLIVHKRPRALYITLMGSFRPGYGTKLIKFLEESSLYSHDFISLRATMKSIGFYLKMDFLVFDFVTMENYVNGTVDIELTEELKRHCGDTGALSKLQDVIVQRDWINTEEFPLLKQRKKLVCTMSRNCRSKSLIQMI